MFGPRSLFASVVVATALIVMANAQLSGQLVTPEWTLGYTRAIYPNSGFQRQYCLEDGQFGNRPDPRYPLTSFQFCSLGQVRFEQNVVPAPSISIGMIGGVKGALVDMGTLSSLGNTYNVGPETLWSSIAYNFSNALSGWTIYSSSSTNQPLNLNGALDTTNSPTTFLPVVNHVYLFRLTSGAVVNNSWSSNMMFGKMFVLSVAADRIELNWVVLWPQPCASNPCGIDAACQSIYPNGQQPIYQCRCTNGVIGTSCGGSSGAGSWDNAGGVSSGHAAGIGFGMALFVLAITAFGVYIYRRVSSSSSTSSSSSSLLSSSASAPPSAAVSGNSGPYQSIGQGHVVNDRTTS